jgi:O-antigen/teichoic acid export membrane protein
MKSNLNTSPNIRSSIVINLIRTVTITVLSFVSFPFAARALGDIGMGQYTLANTFVYYFLIIAKLGIPNLAIRECAKVRDDPVAFSRKVQTFFILQLITTLISFGFLVAIAFSLPSNWTAEPELIRRLIFILSINFLLGALSFEWVYISLEKHLYIAVRSIFALTIGSILIISFVHNSRQLILYAALAFLNTIFTVVFNFAFLKKTGISLKPLGNYNFRQYFKPILAMGILTIVLTFYNQTDTIILGILDPSTASVGSYAIGVKGSEIVITIITSLSAVFIPRATRLYQNENKYFFKNLARYATNIALFIAIPAYVALVILAPDIIAFLVNSNLSGTWTDSSIANATLSVIIISSLVITYSLADIIFSSILLPMGKEKIYLWTIVIGLVLNVFGCILLGKTIFESRPVIGVAIATALSDVIVLIVLIIGAWKYIKSALFNLNSLKIAIAGIMIGALTYYLQIIINGTPFVKILIIILIDGVVYTSLLAVSKERLVTSFLTKKKEAEHES